VDNTELNEVSSRDLCVANTVAEIEGKFGKESDLWVRFEKESVWWKEGYF
jgi:hypothetical protein